MTPLPLDRLDDRSSNGIALAIGRLISTGELASRSQLPTVRAVASQLGVSPTTVSESWRILQSHGAIETDGRRGTFVRGARQGTAPGRYWQVPVDPGTFAIDLSTGTPDPALLPRIGPLLHQAPKNLPVTSYLDAPVLEDLGSHLHGGWPFEPELLTIVDGAQDALDRLVNALVNVGDVVLINNPAFPPVLDMLEQAGAQVVGVSMDDEGLVPAALEAACASEPVALFLQPRAHNPTGITMSKARCEALASILKNTAMTIVEDDHSGDVSGAPLHSLGAFLPDQVVHIRSFSKSHGPDLRLAALGGAATPIDLVVRRRRLGPSWSSRLLQQLLLQMLIDPMTIQAVSAADTEYSRRRALLVGALAERDVVVGGRSGINLWVPVDDEQVALVVLASHGIGAAPGTPFTAGSTIGPTDSLRESGREQQHIRISFGAISDGFEQLAESIAVAATATSSRAR
jgi:DNA-binding transcriptional MocR family regulator